MPPAAGVVKMTDTIQIRRQPPFTAPLSARTSEFSLQSDIQPRMEACGECASFPHTNRVRRRLMTQN
jgi:hypothetical protein